MHGIIKVIGAKLCSLHIICSLGQVKVSLDKYIMAIYLSLGKDNFFGYFHTPDIAFCIVCLLPLSKIEHQLVSKMEHQPWNMVNL